MKPFVGRRLWDLARSWGRARGGDPGPSGNPFADVPASGPPGGRSGSPGARALPASAPRRATPVPIDAAAGPPPSDPRTVAQAVSPRFPEATVAALEALGARLARDREAADARVQPLARRIENLEGRIAAVATDTASLGSAVRALEGRLAQVAAADAAAALATFGEALREATDALQSRLAALERTQQEDRSTLLIRLANLEDRLARSDRPADPVDPAAAATAPPSPTAGRLIEETQMDDLAARLGPLGVDVEDEWNSWRRYRDSPCELAVWLVRDRLPSEAAAGVFAAVDDWLVSHFGGTVRLVIPIVGNTWDPREHDKARTVAVSGGQFRAIRSVDRAGVRCGGAVRRMAKVAVSE